MLKTTNDELEISPAFIAAAKIRMAKRNDYGGLEDYFPFHEKSFLHEIHKKTKRLVSMAKRDTTPVFESVEDNLLDLINYASYYYEFLQRGPDENTDL